jgi:RING-box protein 1
MADIDMADAPPAKTKVAKAGTSAEGDKKRFEVKKVYAVFSTTGSLGNANMS